MEFYVVIPVHNEEQYIGQTLDSLVSQTLLPKKIIVVNDASTDKSQEIIKQYEEKFSFIKSVYSSAPKLHQPGTKVINAFYEGFKLLDSAYEVICKFDGDLIFPPDYIETLANVFRNDSSIGMAGGFCYVKKNDRWELENLTGKDHIRGALKAYRKECFEEIGMLKNAMGWDTIDELLAQYHGWKIKTISSLHVKHLKPTGKVYSPSAKRKQGEAFYRMRYGFILTVIASGKLAFKKKSLNFFINCMQGFFRAKRENLSYIVSYEEGKFIRNFRWKNILKKLKFGS